MPQENLPYKRHKIMPFIENRLVVSSAHEYIMNQHPDWSENQIDKVYSKNSDYYSDLEELIALDVSYYMMRHISGGYGLTIDTLSGLLNRLTIDFNAKYPDQQYIDFNKNVEY